MKIRIVFWIIITTMVLLGARITAQDIYRRYIVPKEYNQEIMQRQMDDIARRLDQLEKGK